jgi:hypothetical protein
MTSILGGAVSDWIHSDHSDEDEAQQPAGAGQIGEYPPRIRWLRKRHLMTLRMTEKCAQQHDSRMMVLAGTQIRVRDPPRSRKRNGLRTSTSSDDTTRLTLVTVL